MKRMFDGIEVLFRDESDYWRNAFEDIPTYQRAYRRSDIFEPISAVGIRIGDRSALLFGVGGISSLHENSVAYHSQRLYVACGDALFTLSFPELELQWCKQVDAATCFGVYLLPEEDELITHGELSVCRISASGEEVWSVSGSDIFTEGFEISDGVVKLTDFNHDRFIVELKTGEMKREEW